ncbi:MAG: heavy metal translocating P-type ATPase [Bacillota bacterium]
MTGKRELILEGLGSRSPQRVYLLMGLDCAHCAGKIEGAVKNLPGVSSVSLDFIARKLRVETESAKQLDELEAEIKRIVNKMEPRVIVAEERDKKDIPAEEHREEKKELIRLFLGTFIYFAAILGDFSLNVELVLFGASYVLIGGEIVLKALRNMARGQVFNENFLMTLATVGAFAIKEYPEAVAVMLFYQIGEFFQDMAVNRSRRSIRALLDIRPDFANLQKGDETLRVFPEEVNIGDIILVKPGEKIPLDGKIIRGQAMLNTALLTGESIPRNVKEGDEVLSGAINTNGILLVEVTKEFGESTVAKILDLVQNASSKKAPTENFITKFARYYTPVVVLTAAAVAVIPPLILRDASFADWFYRALIFLVISCPCALVVSIPLGFFGGIGAASKNGILVKGGNYLEALNHVDTVVFDKTGTLTKGVFRVASLVPKNGLSQEQLLQYAAFALVYSTHPIAKSILEYFGEEIDRQKIDSYEEIAGQGVRAVVGKKVILAGNSKLLESNGILYRQEKIPGTVVHIAVDSKYAGYILISDRLKEDSARALRELRNIGVKRLVMLTGDTEAAAQQVAGELKIDEFYAGLLPHEKVEKMEFIMESKGPGNIIFVGDGINDTPVLARADVGVAMGGLGADAAIEAADVVIMTDEPSKLVTAMKIAKRTRQIVWQNIIFSLGVKIIVLLLGAGGVATMWEAVFADVGVAVIAVLNAMRVMRT